MVPGVCRMLVDPATHRQLAVEANNSTWEFLGREPGDLSECDAEEMTRRAYAAAYHWARAEGTGPANEARAEWLLARVWVARGNGAVAHAHAARCLALCGQHGLVDFDLAYAHEATARALACLGKNAEAKDHLQSARNVHVADPQDKAQVDSDLAAGPWFGLG